MKASPSLPSMSAKGSKPVSSGVAAPIASELRRWGAN
jgi:hypothetical protein